MSARLPYGAFSAGALAAVWTFLLVGDRAHACTSYWLAYAKGVAYPKTAATPLAAVQPDRFGALAVSIDANRYFVMLEPDCYDISSRRLPKKLRFVFNHRIPKGDGAPTYVGFQVVRASPELPANYVGVFRNRSRTGESHWILPRTITKLKDFTGTISDQDGAISAGRYKKDLEDAESITALLDALNTDDLASFNAKFGDWHAIVAPHRDDSPPWRVSNNTALDHRNWRLSPDDVKAMAGETKVIVRNYILKYTPSAKPKVAVTFNVNVAGVSCLYIRPIGHADATLAMRISRAITLKLESGADCLDPKDAFKAR
ncbi:MAG: hypothetical protein ACK4UO_09485 [Pseudolabrys sp.]